MQQRVQENPNFHMTTKKLLQFAVPSSCQRSLALSRHPRALLLFQRVQRKGKLVLVENVPDWQIQPVNLFLRHLIAPTLAWLYKFLYKGLTQDDDLHVSCHGLTDFGRSLQMFRKDISAQRQRIKCIQLSSPSRLIKAALWTLQIQWSFLNHPSLHN